MKKSFEKTMSEISSKTRILLVPQSVEGTQKNRCVLLHLPTVSYVYL